MLIPVRRVNIRSRGAILIRSATTKPATATLPQILIRACWPTYSASTVCRWVISAATVRRSRARLGKEMDRSRKHRKLLLELVHRRARATSKRTKTPRAALAANSRRSRSRRPLTRPDALHPKCTPISTATQQQPCSNLSSSVASSAESRIIRRPPLSFPRSVTPDIAVSLDWRLRASILT